MGYFGVSLIDITMLLHLFKLSVVGFVFMIATAVAARAEDTVWSDEATINDYLSKIDMEVAGTGGASSVSLLDDNAEELILLGKADYLSLNLRTKALLGLLSIWVGSSDQCRAISGNYEGIKNEINKALVEILNDPNLPLRDSTRIAAVLDLQGQDVSLRQQQLSFVRLWCATHKYWDGPGVCTECDYLKKTQPERYRNDPELQKRCN